MYGAALSTISLQLDAKVASSTSYDADAEENQPCFFPEERLSRKDGRVKPKLVAGSVAPDPLPLPDRAYHLSLHLYSFMRSQSSVRALAPGMRLHTVGYVVDQIMQYQE
jgi:hypothetical protein